MPYIISNGLAHWTLPHGISTPSGVDLTNVKMCGFRKKLLNKLVHLKFTLHLWGLIVHRGVWVSNRIAHFEAIGFSNFNHSDNFGVNILSSATCVTVQYT